jgi:hypothetical protein
VRALCCVFLFFTARLIRAEPGCGGVSEFPVQFREGLVWVEVNVQQHKEPLHFLLDSGASASVLNLSTARQLGLALGPQVTVLGVCAKLTGNWPVKISAKVGAVALPGEVLALDLSKLSRVCSNSVDGLIGADFFRDRVVQIDYQAQKVRLLETSPRGSRRQTLPLESRRCGLRVPVSINDGQRQWVRLDTGCATALQWVTTKISTDGCTSKLAVGLAEVPIPQTVTSVTLGGQRVDGVAAGLHRKAIFPGEAGLLGNGMLARFGVVTIDSKAGCVILGSPSQ